MATTNIDYKCPSCKRKRQCTVSWIDPALWAKGKNNRKLKPTITSIRWCDKCHTQLKMTLFFKPNNVVECLKVVKARIIHKFTSDLVIKAKE